MFTANAFRIYPAGPHEGGHTGLRHIVHRPHHVSEKQNDRIYFHVNSWCIMPRNIIAVTIIIFFLCTASELDRQGDNYQFARVTLAQH